MQTFKYLIFLSCVLTITFLYARITKRKKVDPYHTKCSELKKGPVTIFVHGTVFPGVSRFVHHHETNRRGLYHYTAPLSRPIKGKERLGRVLHDAAPEEFPVHSFYKFYWSGKLTFSARKDAAEKLFQILENHTGPVTLIAHSHGCNVALYLAELAQKKKSQLTIDRLVLLAAPVQRATSSLVKAPLFKRVYSVYSTSDALQVADPQGIYNKSDKEAPLFSERTFPACPNLIQTRLLIGRRGPRHIDFITGKLFKHLPQILSLLDNEFTAGNKHVMVNIPSCGNAPHVLTFTSASLPYHPRKRGQCTCKVHPLTA